MRFIIALLALDVCINGMFLARFVYNWKISPTAIPLSPPPPAVVTDTEDNFEDI
jgi:hypothetical protein